METIFYFSYHDVWERNVSKSYRNVFDNSAVAIQGTYARSLSKRGVKATTWIEVAVQVETDERIVWRGKSKLSK